MDISKVFSFLYMSKNLFEKEMAGICKEYKITNSALALILFLSHYPNLNTSREICKFGNLKRGNVSVLVEILTKRGFIVQEHDEHDRRLKYLFLTEKSDDIVNKAKKIHKEFENILISDIKKEDLELLENTFNKMFNTIKQKYNNN